jgi:hypothetical protein
MSILKLCRLSIVGVVLARVNALLTNVTRSESPAFRKVVTPFNFTPGGLMERIHASLQRGRQG